MPYDDVLANRIRERFFDLQNVEEKEMMGGLVFMYNDKMCVGIFKGELMCRIDPEMQTALVEKNGCRAMEISKRRPMKGYVVIEEIAIRSKKDFDYWINLALDFNKKAKSSKRKPKA